jgi:hypothetical protein
MTKTSGKSSSLASVGTARRVITPPSNVELAGLGYYLTRTPERVRDDLTATAMVVTGCNGKSIAFLSLDLLYVDGDFIASVRNKVARHTEMEPGSICINCSHTHNGPTAAFCRGVGEINREYVQSVIELSTQALIEAWQKRTQAVLSVGAANVGGLTFNRTRENGPLDTRLSVLCAKSLVGKPLAVAFNFHSHLTAHLETDFRAVSRDWCGEVVDQIESALPGATALYLQGTAGDVILAPEFNSTARRFEPAQKIAGEVLKIVPSARQIDAVDISSACRQIALPTRRWTREEILADREESVHRQKTGDTKDWSTGFARVITTYPDRLPVRYGGSVERTVAAVSRFGVEWTEDALATYQSRPETIETEVQAFRIGDVWFCMHSAELFSSLGLEARKRWPGKDLFMLGYSNGALGYLPDAFDVKRKSYAANQSPKFTGRFPFTEESGNAMVDGLIDVLQKVKTTGEL